jgi:hypothetical protein
MIKWWFNLTCKERVYNLELKEKLYEIRGQCVSVSGLIYILFYIILGCIESNIEIGLFLGVVVFCLLLFVNRNGKSGIACICIAIIAEVSSSYILLVKGETFAITLFVMILILVSVCLYSYVVLFVALSNIAIIIVYMYIANQLLTNVMYARILVQVTISIAVFICSFVIRKVVSYAIEYEQTVLRQKALEVENRTLKTKQHLIEGDLEKITQTYYLFTNGNVLARVISKDSIIPQVVQSYNLILSRQSKLLTISSEFTRTREAIKYLVKELSRRRKIRETNLTGTPLDQIILELREKEMSEE